MIVTTKKIYCDLCGKEITNDLDMLTFSIRVRFSCENTEKYLDAHTNCVIPLYYKAHERVKVDD